ncbi:MAG: hypothetical protein U0361_15425 [Nitrospiraceae bacterium]
MLTGNLLCAQFQGLALSGGQGETVFVQGEPDAWPDLIKDSSHGRSMAEGGP